MGWWSDIFKTRAKDWIYFPLDSAQVPGGVNRETIHPNQCYVSILLRSMRVVDVRRGFTKFYGSVDSFISLPHRSGKQAQFHTITTPASLKNADVDGIDQVIQLEKRLLGPVPYCGGDIEMEIGLFSIKSADLAAPYLTLLENISKLASVSYITAAIPFLEPLKDGINLICGGSDSSVLEIGLAQQISSPETGYFLVMRAPKGEVDPRSLRVDPADHKLVNASGHPVGDYPYMLYQLQATTTRDDFFMIPDLVGPHNDLRDAVRKGEYKMAEESLTVFRRTVLTCNDLLLSDGQKLVKLVENEVREILGPTATAAMPRRAIRELKEVPLYT